ncbi:MAG: IclR family transcriptional regulator [Bryobacteraceae bacterium]
MAITAEGKADKYRIRVLDRTFDLLDALAESEFPVGTSDLCKRAHLSKSTVHRLLTVLESRQMVEREGDSHRYRLGSKVADLARRSRPVSSLDGMRTFLEELARTTGTTARVGVRRMYEQISLVLTSGRVTRSAGADDVRMPIHCTALGKAIVAFEPLFVGELLPYYRFTPYTSRTITEPARFRAELRKVQICGFAYDNEEYKAGFRCFAAPIRDTRGRVVAALSLSGTTTAINGRNQEIIIQSLQAATEQLASSADLVLRTAANKHVLRGGDF